MEEKVEIELSLPPQLEAVVSGVQKEIMTEELEELSPIKENDVNISTIYVYDDGDELEAKVYFRNALNRTINFEKVSLALVDKEDNVLCMKVFDLMELGDIPAYAATPWKLYFEKKFMNRIDVDFSQCKVVFNSQIRAISYASIEYQELPKEFEDIRTTFEEFLEDLPKMEKNQLSISTFNICLQTGGKVIATLVIRNSADRDVSIQEIPLTIKDENNIIIASGRFTLTDFVLKPMKAKVVNLAFQTDLTTEKSVTKDNWSAIFE
ncbi:SLAP domain-containing protein [Clostridium sp. A1-XYC3]|uniref:SLAP domain-containing protein n=1 Tax=Clostridium tanneri TaxID=3037988 RepID=A0ABU4JXE0_9CLOT|nr:SLAP domain-containing protein [Clostridium sp. A1-XYC3]MDW8802574.1 SLAP domain-containing protein [Clostridium sp. A1-XYC3]